MVDLNAELERWQDRGMPSQMTNSVTTFEKRPMPGYFEDSPISHQGEIGGLSSDDNTGRQNGICTR